MATILQVSIPAAQTVLAQTVETLPSTRCELETTAATYADRTWPGVWIAGCPRSEIGAALADDPTVTGFECLESRDDATLYRLEITETMTTVPDVLQAENGVMLAGSCTDGRWTFEIRFRTRDQLSRTHQQLQERGLSPTVHGIFDSPDDTTRTYGLTEPQREALGCAIDHGYFEIPRQISLEELAATLGISHQALSERLRRAYETLAAAELGVATDSHAVAEMEP